MMLQVEPQTDDWEVAGLTLTRTMLCNKLRQVFHACASVTKSKIWYRQVARAWQKVMAAYHQVWANAGIEYGTTSTFT